MKSVLLTIDPPSLRVFPDLAAAEAERDRLFADGAGIDEAKLYACTALPSSITKTPFSAAQMALIHNAVPGARQIRKFENRDAMARRMLEVIATVEPEAPARAKPAAAPAKALTGDPLVDEQPEFLKRKPGDTRRVRDRDDEDRITMPEPKPGAARGGKAKGKTRAGGKTELVLGLLRRPEGATAEQIMKATDWQRHSVRGFLSTLSKKPGVKLKAEDGDAGRIYRAA